MSLNMDAAIKLTANVSGVSGINQAKTALQQLAGGSQVTTRQLVGLEAVTKKFAAANSNSISGIRNSISALRSLRDQHDINSKGFQRLTKDIEVYEKKLKAASGVRATAAASGSFGGGIGNIGSSIAASLATGAGVAAVFGATAQIETQTRSLQVLTGSAERAKEIVSELKAIGAVTPFETSELIEAAKRLNAFGVSSAEVVDITKRLGDVAGATGSNLGELATAYGQVIAKGRLQGEELLQFQERGVALADELRKMYGLTGAQFTKALEDGAISAKAAEVALKNLTNAGGKYADGAIAQSDTLNGKLSTLRDSFTQLAQHIGTVMTPAFNFLLTNFTSVLNAANDVLQTETLRMQVGNKVPSADAMRQIEEEAAAMAKTRQPGDAFKRNEEFQRLREQGIRNYTRQQGYDNGTLTPPKVAVPVDAPSGAPPLLQKDATDKAAKDQERLANEAQQLATKAANDAAQRAKAQADLERGLMEANARVRQSLDATTNQLAMDAIRRRYDYEQALIEKQQGNWVNSVVGAQRAARGQLASFFRDISGNQSDTLGAAEQEQRAKQRLEAARAGLRTAERSAEIERASGAAYAAAQARADRMAPAGAGAARGGVANMLPGTRGGPNVNQGLGAGRGHQGQDLGIDPGDPIHARRGGRVVQYIPSFTRPGNRFMGAGMRVRYDDGMEGTYGHIQNPAVRVGDPVAAGQRLATVYGDGQNTHLHYELRDQMGRLLDPLNAIRESLKAPAGRVVAAPVMGAPTTTAATPSQPYLDTTGPGLVSARGEVATAELEYKAAKEAAKGAEEQAGKLRALINTGFLQDYTSEFREQADEIQRSNEITATRNRLELEGARPELIDAEVRKAEAQQLYGAKVQAVTDALALLDQTGKGTTVEAETLRTTLQNMGLDYEKLKAAIDATAQSQIAFNDAMRFRQDDRIGAGMVEGAQQYVESIGTMREATAQLAQQGIKGVEDSLVSLATTGTANFQQFAAQMLESTARLIIQQLVLRTILQAVGAIGGGGGGLTGSVVNSAAGSVTSGFGNIANIVGGAVGSAKGNILQGPTSGFQATLHGTEAVLPVRRGSDGNLGVMVTGGKGGGSTNNITINVDANGGSRTSVQGEGDGRELAKAVSQAVQSELVRQQRPGGLLNRRS